MPSGNVNEIRTDPLSGEQVLFSTARANRPGSHNTFVELTMPSEKGEVCPFCRGNEHLTPPAKAQLPSVSENIPWQVRVFPNKYPVVNPVVNTITSDNLFHTASAVTGYHEVIVETPDCISQLHDESVENIFLALKIYRERLNFFRSDSLVQSFQLFKNHGQNAGATMYHAHSQLMALGFITPKLRATTHRFSEYFRETNRNIVADLLKNETQTGARIVHNGNMICCLAPFAATQPFEIHFYPHEVRPHFADTHDVEITELARALKKIFMKLTEIHKKFAYNMTLVTAPAGMPVQAENFCWYMKLIPRLTGIAGFELESGCRINPVLPESYAEKLRF